MLNKDDINARLKKQLQGKTPKLKCLVTGLERMTSMDYLKTKVDKFGSVDNFVNNYISSEAVKLLKLKRSTMDIKNELNAAACYVPNEMHVTEACKYYNV